MVGSRLAMLLLNVGIITSHQHPSKTEGFSDLRQSLVVSLERALNYFERDTQSINVDGLYGLRVAQGQMLWIEQEAAAGRYEMDASSLARVQAWGTRAKLVTASIYARNYAKDPVYLRTFAPLVDKPYMIQYRKRNVSLVHQGDLHRALRYNEAFGDRCFGDMMGTRVDQHTQKMNKCTLTKKCWEYNTLPETSGYFVTHQLLLFVLGEHVGCRSALKQKAWPLDPQYFESRYCRRIYDEARELSSSGHVTARWQDLFSEQILLCGIMGFEEFAVERWLHQVLSWQAPSGCFKSSYGLPEQSVKFSSRKLLREVVARDGCLSHKSGLSTGVLAYFLRVLLMQGKLL